MSFPGSLAFWGVKRGQTTLRLRSAPCFHLVLVEPLRGRGRWPLNWAKSASYLRNLTPRRKCPKCRLERPQVITLSLPSEAQNVQRKSKSGSSQPDCQLNDVFSAQAAATAFFPWLLDPLVRGKHLTVTSSIGMEAKDVI